jgi:hypothetical protein
MPAQFTNQHVYDWLDVHLKGKPAFTKVEPITIEKDGNELIARWRFDGPAAAADLIVSYGDDGNWRGRYWHTYPAEINGQTASAKFPAAKLPCFLSGTAIGQTGIRSSTPLLRLNPDQFAIESATICPDYDGCIEWGGFEPEHITFLRIHTQGGQTRWVPEVSSDAKQGKNSAIAPPGRTLLPLVLSTAEVPHRFSCYVKACEPTRITLQVSGRTREFAVGTDWAECQLEVTPMKSVMGSFDTVIDVAGSTNVLIDSVTFRPAPPSH